MKAITANGLLSGEVVFLASGGSWSDQMSEASLFADAEALDAALQLAKRDEERQLIVGPYEIDVVIEEGAPTPARLRERIRAEGPTVAYGEDVRLERFYTPQAHFG